MIDSADYFESTGSDSTGSDSSEPVRAEAELIADTRDSERRLGLRGRICERRLLFRGKGSYVEMCFPPNASSGGTWLHGQIVLGEPAPEGESVWISLREKDGRRGLPVQASDRGDFALPLPSIHTDDQIQVEIDAPTGGMVARFVA